MMQAFGGRLMLKEKLENVRFLLATAAFLSIVRLLVLSIC